MPNRNSAPVFAIALLLFCVSPSFAQNGVLEASGYGTGANQGVALEAAKIDAVNALVMRNMKRDVVYRDLFLSEAFRNDWFGKPSYVQQGKGKWTATVPIAVDEGIADALYVGRYSTTVGALLDQADAALTDLEAMLAQGGLEESNGVLGASETSYRQAEAKANEILRYLGPVGDATFFSSQGHRKAPELKVLIDALLKSALDGIARIRESQDKLAMNQSARNVLDLIESVEAELAQTDLVADSVYPVSSAPRSYATELLRASSERVSLAREALRRRYTLVEEKTRDLPAEMSYPRERAEMVIVRMTSLDGRLKASGASISSEIFSRSALARTARWSVSHDAREYLNVGFYLPVGVAPSQGSTSGTDLPFQADAKAEAAFAFSSGGLWCRTSAAFGDEQLTGDANSVATQEAALGFYGKAVFGLGFRWDWLRRTEGDEPVDSRTAVSFTIGAAGQDLGGRRALPVWTSTVYWELPGEGDIIIPRDINLALETVIRPSKWIRIEADAGSRARERNAAGLEDSLDWIGNLGLGVGLRVPVLEPVMLRVRWDGERRAAISGDEISGGAVSLNTFRFGLEYSF
ncbi:MAG: hypothetical protein A2Z99_19280 [Treponema sp. GWB1_62_6]|nr:MAG: hypothetical protein A2001_15300 [Treponema sp. GWC1_61_84]OHE67669.1 MAG: hypothetical protein A2Z99_19280 [Treponema sp. GWB1_62_6]OHE72302.1 MAG: hypothetical protein A2413_14975 [Treponema sp. RIFOXYC1_FULL_61_9]HCM28296.1 hypothetical protein [Treponema sp.]